MQVSMPLDFCYKAMAFHFAPFYCRKAFYIQVFFSETLKSNFQFSRGLKISSASLQDCLLVRLAGCQNSHNKGSPPLYKLLRNHQLLLAPNKVFYPKAGKG